MMPATGAQLLLVYLAAQAAGAGGQDQQELENVIQTPTSAVDWLDADIGKPGSAWSRAGGPDARWSELANRLALMESFIAKSSAKVLACIIELTRNLNLCQRYRHEQLYETEERIRQLEACECRLGCRWTSGSNEQTQLRADGETWPGNECDVCSCHTLNMNLRTNAHEHLYLTWRTRAQRGQVLCRHITCPSLNCSDPHHVAGKCCPVCYKPCAYKSQTVRHGNKLVINSSAETCKECVCLDGQFKCQRVQAMTDQVGARPRRHSLSLWPDDTDQPDDEPEEEHDEDGQLLDDYDGHQPGQLEPRPARSKRSGPLLCPQLDCPPERQVRLKNHCCTYCQETDFCSLAKAGERCHPDAICTSQPTANLSASTTFEDTFGCTCKPGFTGNARLACHDMDECAGPAPVCDSTSTDCRNTPGSFECTCKPGFKRPEEADSKAACVDVDECADGKLNRCHPQAHCVNLAGSYRCKCRRGFLGNGFECHKWFSSAPNVASYLHEHRAAGSPNEPVSLTGADDHDTDSADDNSLLLRPAEAHSPLGSSSAQQQSSYATNNQPTPSANIKSNASLHSNPDSNKDRLERLMTGWNSMDETNSSLPPLARSQEPRESMDLAVHLPEALALNTRTMFFQPPPRARKPQQAADNATLSSSPPPNGIDGLSLTGSGRTQDLSAPPASSYSDSRQQQQPPPTAILVPSLSSDITRLANKSTVNGTSYKKGTIIASATTSQYIKGHGFSRLGHTSSRQLHKSRNAESSSSSTSQTQDRTFSFILIVFSLGLVIEAILQSSHYPHTKWKA